MVAEVAPSRNENRGPRALISCQTGDVCLCAQTGETGHFYHQLVRIGRLATKPFGGVTI